MRILNTPYDGDKFKNLVHYVCSISPNPKVLGATKLNKILWYSELNSFLSLGKPITGAKFVKRQFGPVAKATLPVLENLRSEGAIIIVDTEHFGKPKKEYISVRKPDLSSFTPEEISIITQITEVICKRHTASSISLASHDDIWEMAEIGEEIPLSTVFAVRGEVTEDDVAWADEIIEKEKIA
jgi:hypothetical protein